MMVIVTVWGKIIYVGALKKQHNIIQIIIFKFIANPDKPRPKEL